MSMSEYMQHWDYGRIAVVEHKKSNKMRCSAIINTILINLVIFGMGGYLYMITTKYSIPLRRDSSMTSTYDRQIYLYNRGYLLGHLDDHETNDILSRTKHETKSNFAYISRSRPMLSSSNTHELPTDTNQFQCSINETKYETCRNKTMDFKNKILVYLNAIFKDESNILKAGNLNNTYNVHYSGPREDFRTKNSNQLLCELLNVKFETLKRMDIDAKVNIRSSIPKRSFFENKYFNNCAIVASSGALRNSKLGKFIDSHDIVLRFNHAPTEKFANDVGSKTSIRVLNSQVVTKPEFNFLRSKLYKNISLVIWDPSNYSTSVDEWLKKPEYNFFPNVIQYRRQEPKPRIFIFNPSTIWEVWDFLQRNSPARLRKNPPSSGFLGLRLLLPHCNFVNLFEYIPSTRVTKRCHYYDPEENLACTFGVWHPLSAEKLLTYHLNEASDFEVFQKGFVRIRGFQNLKC